MRDIKEILKIEDKEIELSERSVEIDTTVQNKECREIVSALKQTLKKNNLVALSAPAIGIQRRIFVINFEEEIKTFINPVILNAKGLELSKETCSSIPGRKFLMLRNNDINVIYQKPTGKIESRELKGRAAFVFQHELQHLDGVLLSDLGLEIDEDFENATEQEKDEIVGMYLESLDIRKKELDEEIKTNEELKQMSDAIDYMTSVYKGETKLETEG